MSHLGRLTLVTQVRVPWTHRTESERQIMALGLAAMLSIVAVDFALGGRLSFFFDLCFITLCLVLAARVAPGGFFTVALLPPPLMIVVFALVGVTAPEVIADPRDGVVQAVVTGLAHHSGALFAGYALCLATLEYRRRLAAVVPVRVPATAYDQDSNLEGSPAPTRSTSG
jgi:hypothetical protein